MIIILTAKHFKLLAELSNMIFNSEFPWFYNFTNVSQQMSAFTDKSLSCNS